MIVLGVVFGLLCVAWALTFFLPGLFELPLPDSLAAWGDSFNIVTSLFSGLALLGVVYGGLMQRREMLNALKEMQKQSKSQEASLAEQRKAFEQVAERLETEREALKAAQDSLEIMREQQLENQSRQARDYLFASFSRFMEERNRIAEKVPSVEQQPKAEGKKSHEEARKLLGAQYLAELSQLGRAISRLPEGDEWRQDIVEHIKFALSEEEARLIILATCPHKRPENWVPSRLAMTIIPYIELPFMGNKGGLSDECWSSWGIIRSGVKSS